MLLTLRETAAMGKLATKSTAPAAVASNEIGRATRTSTTMEVGLPPVAHAGVVVLSMTAKTQTTAVKRRVRLLRGGLGEEVIRRKDQGAASFFRSPGNGLSCSLISLI